MSISEFKTSVRLIIGFAARLNSEAVPNDIKKAMIKAYASTLRINLSYRMVESLIKVSDAHLPMEPYSKMA